MNLFTDDNTPRKNAVQLVQELRAKGLKYDQVELIWRLLNSKAEVENGIKRSTTAKGQAHYREQLKIIEAQLADCARWEA